MMKKLIALALMLLAAPSPAAEFTSARITQAAAVGLECYEYCVVALCVHLNCGPFGCRIETSPRIRHHAPDLVVSAYKEPGENPWVEMRTVLEAPAKAAVAAQIGALGEVPPGGGPNYTARDTAPEGDRGSKSRSLHYKEATVIGSPVVGFVDEVLPLSCPSGVAPLNPYFQSELDALTWRFGLAEMAYPQTWTPGLREIGPWPAGTWGSVYPRHGFVTAVEPPKAAAVAAQRAADIATRSGQPHVYMPAPVEASDESTDHWQMISPKLDRSCAAFGTLADYSPGRVARDEKYGFLYWPRYECCPLGNGVLLGTIPITPVCSGE